MLCGILAVLGSGLGSNLVLNLMVLVFLLRFFPLIRFRTLVFILPVHMTQNNIQTLPSYCSLDAAIVLLKLPVIPFYGSTKQMRLWDLCCAWNERSEFIFIFLMMKRKYLMEFETVTERISPISSSWEIEPKLGRNWIEAPIDGATISFVEQYPCAQHSTSSFCWDFTVTGRE